MSGQQIGSVAGGIIGSFFGPVGTVIGSAIGGAIGGEIDPVEIKGPRLDSLKVQKSEYGAIIHCDYGRTAHGGTVMWASDLIEVESTDGGKGTETTQFKYFGNMAVLICLGERALGKIWAGPDRRLIYDPETGELESGTLRFYSGSLDQLPDPLIESYEGVGNVPGYRGWCYLVLENFALENDANMLPFLTIETGPVGTEGSEDLNTVWPVGEAFVDEADGTYAVTISGAQEAVIVRNLADNSFVHKRTLTNGYVGSRHSFYDPDRNRIFFIDSGGVWYISLDDGSQDGWDIFTGWPLPALTSLGDHTPVGGVYHNGLYCFLMEPLSAPGTVAISSVDPDTLDGVSFYTGDAGTAVGSMVSFCGHRQEGDGYILGATKAGTVRKFPLSAGFTSISCGACVPNSESTAVDPNTGYVWSMSFTSPMVTVYANDPLTETQLYAEAVFTSAFSYSTSAPRRGFPWTFKPPVFPFTGRAILNGYQWLATDYFTEFEAGEGGVPSFSMNTPGVYHGTGDVGFGFWNPVDEQLWFWRSYAWLNRSAGDNDLANLALFGASGDDYGIYLGAFGGPTLGTAILSEIVADISERCDADASEYDVSQLTDEVIGYSIDAQVTGADAIRPLMMCYYFDGVESNKKMKYVKRGGALAATIPDGKLNAFASGGSGGDPIAEVRSMENELPQTLTVRYLLQNTDYSIATKYQRRLIGASGDERLVDLPIVLTDYKGQEVVDVQIHTAWWGRIVFGFSLPPEYAYLEPTDRVHAGGYDMRILKIIESMGILKCEAVRDDADLYSPHVIVTETPPSGKTVSTPGLTMLELM